MLVVTIPLLSLPPGACRTRRASARCIASCRMHFLPVPQIPLVLARGAAPTLGVFRLGAFRGFVLLPGPSQHDPSKIFCATGPEAEMLNTLANKMGFPGPCVDMELDTWSRTWRVSRTFMQKKKGRGKSGPLKSCIWEGTKRNLMVITHLGPTLFRER